jgi:phospholipid transport system substrate-binding protein
MAARRSTIALGLVLALASGLQGAAPPEDAGAVVRRMLADAVAIARAGGDRDESLAKLRGVARGILDTRTMGRRALGDVLAAQPAEQQQAYLELFDELMVRAYLQKLLLFRDPRFEYGTPRQAGAALIVPTRIVTSKDTYRVDYEMQERDGRWVATDVIVEDISLTDNYKAQFESLLANRSFAELLDLLRTKTRAARKEPP